MSEERIVLEFPVYYDLYLPQSTQPPLVIATHGYGGDKTSMMGLARRILGDGFAIAALQGPHQHMNIREGEPGKRSFGFGWLTNFKPEESVALHHAAILRILARLSDSIDHDRVFLLGFSQSVGVNFRFAFTHPKIVKGVVAVCGGIPGDWNTDGKYASGAIDVLYIGGERDDFYSPDRIRSFAESLRKRARSVEFQMLDAPHEVPPAAYGTIREWLERVSAS